jgi:hypothetical protein
MTSEPQVTLRCTSHARFGSFSTDSVYRAMSAMPPIMPAGRNGPSAPFVANFSPETAPPSQVNELCQMLLFVLPVTSISGTAWFYKLSVGVT